MRHKAPNLRGVRCSRHGRTGTNLDDRDSPLWERATNEDPDQCTSVSGGKNRAVDSHGRGSRDSSALQYRERLQGDAAMGLEKRGTRVFLVDWPNGSANEQFCRGSRDGSRYQTYCIWPKRSIAVGANQESSCSTGNTACRGDTERNDFVC